MDSHHGDIVSEATLHITNAWAKRELKATEDELHQLMISSKKNLPLELFEKYNNKIKKLKSNEPNFKLDHNHELALIDQELLHFYPIDDPDNFNRNDYSTYPLCKLLLEKRAFLLKVKAHFEIAIPKPDEAEPPKERKGALKAIFDIGKKLVDTIDDVWAAMRSFLPHQLIEAVSPILIGSVGFIIHLGEGYEGGKLAYEAYQNEKIGQRKTRILTSVLTFMLAGAGAGMSVAFVASAAGAAVSAGAVALFPVLIPSALTAIYGLSLWRQSYIFHRAKEEENKAWDEYQKALEEMSGPLADIDNFNKESDHDHAIILGTLGGIKQHYEELREKRLEAEGNVAFTTMEVAASILVLVGLALGTTAVVGAAAASMGIAPLALIVTGVVFGVGTKYFEKMDEDANHVHIHKIRNWFVNTFNYFTHKKSKVVSEIKSENRLNMKTDSSHSPSQLATVSSSPHSAEISSTSAKKRKKSSVKITHYQDHFLSGKKTKAGGVMLPYSTPSLGSLSSKAKKSHRG